MRMHACLYTLHRWGKGGGRGKDHHDVHTQHTSKTIFMENAMRDLSTTLCRGIARQLLASTLVRACLDGRSVLPGQPVSSDGLA